LQARIDFPPSNAEMAEILSREASEASYVLQHAYRRGAGNLNSSISPSPRLWRQKFRQNGS
jgi:hypothetical protein